MSGKEVARLSYCHNYQDDAKPHLPTDDLKLTEKQAHVTTVRSRRSSSQVNLEYIFALRLFIFLIECYVAIIQFMLWNIQLLKLLSEHTFVSPFFTLKLHLPF